MNNPMISQLALSQNPKLNRSMSMARKRRYDLTEQEADSSHVESAAQPGNVEEKMVTDEEIDEFFAILKRAQEARNWILGVKKDNGGEVKGDTWQPRFAPEDFQLENSTGVASSVVPATGRPLDLNQIPDEISVDTPTPTYEACGKATRYQPSNFNPSTRRYEV